MCLCIHLNQSGAILSIQDSSSFFVDLLARAQDGGLQTLVSNSVMTPVLSPVRMGTEQPFVYFFAKFLRKIHESES